MKYLILFFLEFDAKKLFKMYKHALKTSDGGDTSKKSSPSAKAKSTSVSPQKRPKDDSLTQNGSSDDRNKSLAKKKKKDKEKDREKETITEKDKHREAPKSDRFTKVGNANKPPPHTPGGGPGGMHMSMNKNKRPPGAAGGLNNSPMKRKRDDNESCGGASNTMGDGKSLSFKRLNMDDQGRLVNI